MSFVGRPRDSSGCAIGSEGRAHRRIGQRPDARNAAASGPHGGNRKQLIFGTCSGLPLNGSNVLTSWWHPTLARAGVPRLHLDSLRHTYASLARSADVSGLLVSHATRHAASTLVDQVYASALPSGMAQLAERVAEQALGLKPELRSIDGSKLQSIGPPFDVAPIATTKQRVSN